MGSLSICLQFSLCHSGTFLNIFNVEFEHFLQSLFSIQFILLTTNINGTFPPSYFFWLVIVFEVYENYLCFILLATSIC